jgi:hypothetical protein
LVASLYAHLDAHDKDDLETAEMVKYVDNCWHALKIGYNEIDLCKSSGIIDLNHMEPSAGPKTQHFIGILAAGLQGVRALQSLQALSLSRRCASSVAHSRIHTHEQRSSDLEPMIREKGSWRGRTLTSF